MTTQDKERQILAAAEVLFTTRRFHEVTMDEVCQQAEVGKGTIYRYFKDKDDLFQRLITSGSEELGEIVQSESASAEPFAAQLERVILRMRRVMRRRRSLFHLMHQEETRKIAFHEDARARWKAQQKALMDAVATFMRRGHESNALRTDIAPETLAAVLMGMLRSLSWNAEAMPDDEASAKLLTDLFLRGAAAPLRA